MGLLDGLLQGYLEGQDRQHQRELDLARQIAQQHAMKLQDDEFTYQKDRDLIGDRRYDKTSAAKDKQQAIENNMGLMALGKPLYQSGLPGSQIGSFLQGIAPTLGADPSIAGAFNSLPTDPAIQARKDEAEAKRQSQQQIAQVKAAVAQEALQQKGLREIDHLTIKHALEMADTPEEAQQAANWIRSNLFRPVPSQVPGTPQQMPTAAPMAQTPAPLSGVTDGTPRPPMDLNAAMGTVLGGAAGGALSSPDVPALPLPATGFDPSAPFGGTRGSQNTVRAAQAAHLGNIDRFLPEKMRLDTLRLSQTNAKTQAELAQMAKTDPAKAQLYQQRIALNTARIAQMAEDLRQSQALAPWQVALASAHTTAAQSKVAEDNLPAIRKAMQSASTQMRLSDNDLRSMQSEATRLLRHLEAAPDDVQLQSAGRHQYNLLMQTMEGAAARRQAAKEEFNRTQKLLNTAELMTPTNGSGKPLPGAPGLPKITPESDVKARQPGGSLTTRPVGRSGQPLSALDRLRQKYGLPLGK